MTFSRVNALGWTDDFSTITAAQINGLDVNMTSALDGLNGGYYTPTAELAIGGQGLHIWDASLVLGDGAGQNGVLDIKEDSAAYVRSGAAVYVQSGGALSLAGVTTFSGHDHRVLNGGWLTFDAGSAGYVKGTLSIGVTTTAGTLTTAVAGTVNLYGNTGNSGGTYFKAGSETFQEATATLELSGDTTLKSGGTLTTDSGSTSTFDGDAVHNGDVDLNGTTTFTGPIVPSGASACRGARRADITDAPGQTITAASDFYYISPSVSRIVTILDGSAQRGQVVRVYCSHALPAGVTITFKDQLSNTLAVITENGKRGQFVDLMWDGPSGWVLAGGGDGVD